MMSWNSELIPSCLSHYYKYMFYLSNRFVDYAAVNYTIICPSLSLRTTGHFTGIMVLAVIKTNEYACSVQMQSFFYIN